VALNGQEAPLVIGQQKALLAELLEQGFNLRVLKANDLLLPLRDPATQGGE
jgi:hypothetical protein